jgi:hypothetical protein
MAVSGSMADDNKRLTDIKPAVGWLLAISIEKNDLHFSVIEVGAMSSAGKPAMEIPYHLPRVIRTHATISNDLPNRSAMR